MLTWIATLAIALFAAVSLRRQSLDGRAAFLLTLYERWNDLDDSRKEFAALTKEVRDEVRTNHGGLQEKHQIQHLRSTALRKLSEIQQDTNPAQQVRFRYLMSLLSFLEMLGTYAKNRYLPIRDIVQLYKGPILQAEVMFSDFIAQWQQDAHMPPGLFRYALYVMRRVKQREVYWYLRWLL
jgi:hypothetical protein